MTFDFLCWHTDPNNCGFSPLRNPKLAESESFSAPVSRWNAYLNQLLWKLFCLGCKYAPGARAYAFTQHLGTGQWDNDCLGYNSTGATLADT